MPLCKIVKEDEAADIAFEYAPKKFPVTMPSVANDFIKAEANRKSSGFKIEKLVADQIGLSEKENKQKEQKIEEMVLEKLKEVQERAYEEAKNLGFEEGRTQAFDEEKQRLSDRITALTQMTETMGSLLVELVSSNESRLVHLVTHLAGRVAMREIDEDRDRIIPVLKSAITESLTQEKLTIRVGAEDYDHLMETARDLSKEIDNFQNIKFEKDEAISPGGCIIETNYGTVDATLEKRVANLWEAMIERTKPVASKVESE